MTAAEAEFILREMETAQKRTHVSAYWNLLDGRKLRVFYDRKRLRPGGLHHGTRQWLGTILYHIEGDPGRLEVTRGEARLAIQGELPCRPAPERPTEDPFAGLILPPWERELFERETQR